MTFIAYCVIIVSMENRHILVVDDQLDLRVRLADFITKSGKYDEISIVEKMKARLSKKPVDLSTASKKQGKEINYNVDMAATGEEGVQMVRDALEKDCPYAMIFLDMRMPSGWDGLETMEKIFSVDQKVQIVICTAYADYSWKDIVARVGVRDNLLILKKPFDNMEVAQLALSLTEKYNSEERIRQTQKMDTIGNLAAGLAHDFNNIIGSIQATLSSLEFTINTGKDITSIKKDVDLDFETLKSAAGQGAEMVEILLSLSRAQELPFSNVDLNQIAQNTIKICRRTLDKSVEIIFVPSEEKAEISAYPVQIEQILLNLCINAAHAMTIMRPDGEKKGGKLKIEIQNISVGENMISTIPDADEGDYRLLSIEDSGVGIPSDSFSKIFDPFYTTKKKDNGSGLGLSMVYNIVRKHKGFLELFSKPGKGTTFFIFLPAAETKEETENR